LQVPDTEFYEPGARVDVVTTFSHFSAKNTNPLKTKVMYVCTYMGEEFFVQIWLNLGSKSQNVSAPFLSEDIRMDP
jgi:hypothetical protein